MKKEEKGESLGKNVNGDKLNKNRHTDLRRKCWRAEEERGNRAVGIRGKGETKTLKCEALVTQQFLELFVSSKLPAVTLEVGQNILRKGS